MSLNILRLLFDIPLPQGTKDQEITSMGYVPWRKISHPKLPEYVYPVHGEPLDYTFKELKSLAELATEEPNSGTVKRRTKSPEEGRLTKPHSILKVDNGATKDGPGGGAIIPMMRTVQISEQKSFAKPQGDGGFVNSITVRASNNCITSMEGLSPAMAAVLDDPAKLSWLDLSHNLITSIDPSILQFQDLTTLYLHSNKISSLQDIEKLTCLPRLQKLTLHGNPIESHHNYRLHVMCLIPTLRSLDFIAITKLDRDRVTTYRRALESQAAVRALRMGDY